MPYITETQYQELAEAKYGLEETISDLKAENARLREALKEIQKGEGAYSTDQLEHAGNTIENMKNIAREALKAGE